MQCARVAEHAQSPMLRHGHSRQFTQAEKTYLSTLVVHGQWTQQRKHVAICLCCLATARRAGCMKALIGTVTLSALRKNYGGAVR